jgi:hypothetical protein
VASTPSSPRRKAAARSKTGEARKLAVRPRQRLSKKDTPDSAAPSSDQPLGGVTAPAARPSVRQTEQIAILVLALILGLIGLAFHVVWLGSIVLMSVLLGLIAADVRGRGGRGVNAELVAEANNVGEDITGGGASADNEAQTPSTATAG